ncbi:MAG: hypothetical protein ACM3H7_08940 [Acidobacteriaceae bacterium]
MLILQILLIPLLVLVLLSVFLLGSIGMASPQHPLGIEQPAAYEEVTDLIQTPHTGYLLQTPPGNQDASPMNEDLAQNYLVLSNN